MIGSIRADGVARRRDPVEVHLVTPGEAPDQSKTGHLRRRLNQLLFADLRFSYGQ